MKICIYVLNMILMVVAVSGYSNWNSTHICCDGNVATREPNATTYCCGSVIYDSQTDACCGEQLDELPVDADTSYGCCLDQSTGKQRAYDYNAFVCCDGEVLKKEDPDQYYSCCGSQLHLYQKTMCCNEKIVERRENLECCGDKFPYDSQTELCCPEFDNATEDWTYKLMKVENNHTELCKTETYNTETHACCSDKVVPKDSSLKDIRFPGCCESSTNVTAYNYSSHVCCASGLLLEIPDDLEQGDYAECCAEELFTNHSWQQCCNDQVIDRPDQYTGYCCGSELVTNYTTQFCCDEVIYEQEEDDNMGCCNGKVMNSNTQYCCGGNPCDVDDVKYANCCYWGRNETIFDTRMEVCGTDGVNRLSDEEIEKKAALANSDDPLCQMN